MSSILNIARESYLKYIDNFKNLNKDKFIHRTLPSIASASYLIHSSKFLAPNLFSNLFGDYSISFSNALLLNSIFGNILFMLSTKHMRQIKLHNALGFCVFSSIMFNFGSILFWMFSKVYMPENESLLMIYGFLTGFIFLNTGRNYLKSIDKNY